MNEGYIRQRRNLLSISILLLLAIFGEASKSLLFPVELGRPFVAELFAWIGFFYFWYRIKIYGPNNIFQLFKDEIVVAYIFKYHTDEYHRENVVNFSGYITKYLQLY